MQDSPWDEMTGQAETDSEEDESSSDETLEESISRMYQEISRELVKVHSGRYDEKKAIRAAALALKAQMDLSSLIADDEARAKGCKVALKEIEAEVYFEARDGAEKKLSEAALTQIVAKDKKTSAAEAALVEAEKNAKRWANMSNHLKEAHIFFRTIGKNDWSI